MIRHVVFRRSRTEAVPGKEGENKVTRTGSRENTQVRMLRVHHDDPRVEGMHTGLLEEYTERYCADGSACGMTRFPVHQYASPHRRVVLAELDGEILAGGAIRRYYKDPAKQPEKAEFKRFLPCSRHRRKGLARKIMTALEQT